MKKLFILLLVLLVPFQAFAEDIVASIEIEDNGLTDPLQVTEEPYTAERQDEFQIKIDTTQFTVIDNLSLGDKVKFELETFDFEKEFDTSKIISLSFNGESIVFG